MWPQLGQRQLDNWSTINTSLELCQLLLPERFDWMQRETTRSLTKNMLVILSNNFAFLIHLMLTSTFCYRCIIFFGSNFQRYDQCRPKYLEALGNMMSHFESNYYFFVTDRTWQFQGQWSRNIGSKKIWTIENDLPVMIFLNIGAFLMHLMLTDTIGQFQYRWIFFHVINIFEIWSAST